MTQRPREREEYFFSKIQLAGKKNCDKQIKLGYITRRLKCMYSKPQLQQLLSPRAFTISGGMIMLSVVSLLEQVMGSVLFPETI